MRAVLVLALLGGSGCLAEYQRVGRGLTSGSVSGLGDVDPAEFARLRKALLGDVDLARGVREIADAMVRGVADGVRDEKLVPMVDAVVDRAMARAAAAGQEKLIPLAGALKTQLLGDARELFAEVGRDGDRLAARLTTSVVDALFAAAKRNLHGVSDELDPQLARLAHDTGRALVTGMIDGLDGQRLHAILKESASGLGEGVGQVVHEDAHSIATGVAVAMSVLALLLMVGGLILWRQHLQSLAALRVIANRIHEAEEREPESTGRLRQAIAEHARRSNVGTWLARFFERNGR
jgi:hypothetical protein